MPLVDLQCMIVVLPDHTHLLFKNERKKESCVGSGTQYTYNSKRTMCTTFTILYWCIFCSTQLGNSPHFNRAIRCRVVHCCKKWFSWKRVENIEEIRAYIKIHTKLGHLVKQIFFLNWGTSHNVSYEKMEKERSSSEKACIFPS